MLETLVLEQRKLSEKISLQDDFGDIEYIAGMDVSNNWRDPEQMIYASVVVLRFSDLKIIETANASLKQTLPYIPGFLGFREAPVLIQAYEKLKTKPTIILVDGHGISHPRKLGIASHVGVLLDMPTIGVAKSILIGEPKGSDLVWKHEKIATVFQSKKNTKPLFISPGHKVSFERALKIVQQCLTKYRLPEPTRLAHLAANAYRRSFLPVIKDRP